MRILHCCVAHGNALQHHSFVHQRKHRARWRSCFVYAAQRPHRQRRKQRRRKPLPRNISQIKPGCSIGQQEIIQKVARPLRWTVGTRSQC